MRILDDPHFIVVDFVAEHQSYDLSVIPEDQLSQISWRSSTRISPLWPIALGNDARQLDRESTWCRLTEDSVVCFLGPVSPAHFFASLQNSLLKSLQPGDVWISLGHFNFVLFLKDNEEADVIRGFCVHHACHAEFWRVLDEGEDSQIRADNIEYYTPLESEIRKTPDNLPRPSEVFLISTGTAIDAGIKQAYLELSALYSVATWRSYSFYQCFVKDLNKLSTSIPKMEEILLGMADYDSVEPTKGADEVSEMRSITALKQRDLILAVNAGLSRLNSQAFSGTSPIIQTECHFWPHSLLGIGVACLALRNLTYFLIDTINKSGFNGAFRRRLSTTRRELSGIDTERVALALIEMHEPDETRLIDEVAPVHDTNEEEKEDTPPLIPYYSAREGFRYGVFTVSAPLLAIGGANSRQWNLGTISHEIAHRAISPKIEGLLNGTYHYITVLAKETLKDICNRRAKSIEEAAIILMIRQLNVSEAHRLGSQKYQAARLESVDFIKTAISHHQYFIDEKLVHMFDYLHFYNLDPGLYVSSIWQSWAVQPAIETKYEQYIERTLVALSVRHLDRANWVELTIRDFKVASKASNFWKQALYRKRLEDELRGDVDDLKTLLKINRPLVDIFNIVFRNDLLARLLERERRDLSQAKPMVVYDVTGLNFPLFQNPLKVARELASDKVPNASRSAWLLSLLAFGFQADEDVTDMSGVLA